MGTPGIPGTGIVMATPAEIVVEAPPVVDVVGRIARIREDWIAGKRDELARALAAQRHLKGSGASEGRLSRLRERIGMLRKVVASLEAGYVPLPRFDSEALRLETEQLPLSAIVAIDEAKALDLFDELRLVSGRESRSRSGWGTGRLPQRDPLVIGVVRTPEHRELTRDRGWDQIRVIPGMEEHFLVAWWRPEDEHAEEMF